MSTIAMGPFGYRVRRYTRREISALRFAALLLVISTMVSMFLVINEPRAYWRWAAVLLDMSVSCCQFTLRRDE